MKRMIVLLSLVCASVSMLGCAVESTDEPSVEENIGVASSKWIIENSLTPNALNPNALNPNALNPNALNPNALNPNALAPSALAAIKASGQWGDLSRQLLRYIVSCAFGTGQYFRFNWTDSSGVVHYENYEGSLGIYQAWAVEPLNVSGQWQVSACLAARTNWYGTPVMLSGRESCQGYYSWDAPAEYNTYTYEEGAFFGNLFSSTPRLYACYNESNRAHSRAMQRVCAAGKLDQYGNVQACPNITILGPCSQHCQPINTWGYYYPYCTTPAADGGVTTDKVMTVYLQ